MWSDAEAAQKIMKERTALATQIEIVQEMDATLSDSMDFIAMGEEEGDASVVADAEKAIQSLHQSIQKKQLETLLSGEADHCDAFLEINSGAGGTESCDWALMLMRMYIRWAERRGYKVEVMEESTGEEAGIKSATLRIYGFRAYGWAKTENGVHRLVRISPFDSGARRHTSFASIAVSPALDDAVAIEVDEKDLRIDTYRSSGAGGQHVNTTDSAVRITHIPSGIVVACQNDRSQHKNRAGAMSMLKARLYEAEIQKREEEKAAAHGEKTDIGWGHQIRSYVLHPYQLVKDLRTGEETSNTQAVLDGDIDAFLEAALAAKIGKG